MAGWLPNDFSPDDHEAKLREDGNKMPNKMSGEDLYLEAVAANILATGRRGTTKHSELRDYLSESQLLLRRSREVNPTQGFPESHLYSGLYRRVYNPNSRGTHSSNSIPSFDESDDGHQ